MFGRGVIVDKRESFVCLGHEFRGAMKPRLIDLEGGSRSPDRGPILYFDFLIILTVKTLNFDISTVKIIEKSKYRIGLQNSTVKRVAIPVKTPTSSGMRLEGSPNKKASIHHWSFNQLSTFAS